MKRIKDVLGEQFLDFLEYCDISEKKFISDISLSDYVAFRVKYDVSRDYVNKIKDRIINCKSSEKVDYIVVPKKREIVNIEGKQKGEFNARSSSEDVHVLKKFADSIDKNTATKIDLLCEEKAVNHTEEEHNKNEKFVKSDINSKEMKFNETIGPLYKKFNIANSTNQSYEMQSRNNKIVSIIDAEINGKIVSIDDLDDQELAIYYSIKNAIEICGEGFYIETKSNLNYVKILTEVLHDYYVSILDALERKNKICRNYCSIPLELKNKSAKLLYNVYDLRDHRKLAILENIDEKTTFSEVINNAINKSSIVYYQALEDFFQWINNINIDNIVQRIFSRDALLGRNKVNEDIKDKYWLVLELRSEGETLENIGSLTDSTRERIRQIEKKCVKQLAVEYQNNEYDLLAIIYVLCGEDSILSKKEVKSLIGEKYANLLWLLLSKNLLNCGLYKYLEEYDSVIFIEGGKNNTENIKNALKELPEMFFEEEKEKIADNLSKKYNVSKELIVLDIEGKYSKYGTLYSQSSPTVTFMCSYILKKQFSCGFKIGDVYEIKRFKECLVEVFGDKKGKMTSRAIEAKIGEVGVLCDRGKYLHPDYLQVEKWVMDEINNYIEANHKIVITYSEIFDKLQTVLSGTRIANRYMLQGVLKFYGCKYKLAKDYISKDKNRNLTDEFEDFARNCVEFHKTDFFAAFPSMSDANLAMLTGRCQNVFSIDNGYYMHSSGLNLIDQDYDDIRKYLDDVCSVGPSNSRYLFDEMSYKFASFMSRNEISNHTKLFGVLNYMFGEEYLFSRPYISKEEYYSLTNRDVVLRYLEGVDIITIEDVIAICQEQGIRYMSSGYLIKQITPNFIRINETTLMRYELTGINDDVILEVATYIINRVKENKYCSAKTLNDFIWFPSINIQWTSYLVESVMCLAGDIVAHINMPTSNMTNITSIYVCDELAENDYITFILQILDCAFSKGLFTSRVEIKDFLFDKGLISNNRLPNFLEGADYYYINEEGILQRRY